MTRFELAASTSRTWRSTKLSHISIAFGILSHIQIFVKCFEDFSAISRSERANDIVLISDHRHLCGECRANDLAPHHLHRIANPVLSDLRMGMRGPCGRAPFFFLLFSPTFSHFLLSAKEEKEKIGKKTLPQVILKRSLSRWERCHGYTVTERG